MLSNILSTKDCYNALSEFEKTLMNKLKSSPTVDLLKYLCIESCEAKIIAASAAIYDKGHDMLIDRGRYLYQYNGVSYSMQNP